MDQETKAALTEQLKRHEGLRLKSYLCTAGKRTIGYGRNLDDVGISEATAAQMLDEDIERVLLQLKGNKVFQQLDPLRQQVLANMAFNLGYPRLMGFKKMWVALELGDYKRAGAEMLDSRWAGQVGDRATELAAMMWSGLAG